jgi:hypothetical protein
MEDEALVVLSQECAVRPATDVLLLRYYEPISKAAARSSRKLPESKAYRTAE